MILSISHDIKIPLSAIKLYARSLYEGLTEDEQDRKDYVDHLLRGDVERAIEVMENLMENALKYGDGRRITISFHEEDGCQIIDVFNTGEVIKRQEIPHLFDSFFRGSNAKGKEGNGLGLYICKQIMQKMGGEVYVQTRAEGMSFCLVFMQ